MFLFKYLYKDRNVLKIKFFIFIENFYFLLRLVLNIILSIFVYKRLNVILIGEVYYLMVCFKGFCMNLIIYIYSYYLNFEIGCYLYIVIVF